MGFDWGKTAGATFAGTVAALALVVVPTFIWLPREFDRLTKLSEQAETASKEAAANSSAVATAVQELILATARTTATRLNFNSPDISFASVELQKFRAMVPRDVYLAFSGLGSDAQVLYGEFNKREWVFVGKSTYSELDSSIQDALEKSLKLNGVELILEDIQQSTYPQTEKPGIQIVIPKIAQ